MTTALRVALAGNPNCGKTALFNALTGMEQRVGNWPGVTVDRKEGHFFHADQSIAVVDLPGVYSLISHSEHCGIDEKIACQHLLSGEVDVIVNVIDATNLERHLYLTTQLLELSVPVVVAVNMLDILEQSQASLDLVALQQRLGCPVVGIIANRRYNIDGLQQALLRRQPPGAVIVWPQALQVARSQLANMITAQQADLAKVADFIALQLLEGDTCINHQVSSEVLQAAQSQITAIETELNEDLDIVLADRRYSFCHEVKQACLQVAKDPKPSISQRLDSVVLNRWLGVPIFLLVMYAMFFFAVNIGGAFQDFFDLGSAAIFVNGVAVVLGSIHAPGWLIAILANGLGKGINTTVTFIPMIAGLFFFLSFLEDSGYMARAAFVMDRLMRSMGLPGEAFVPMIIGFGCNVPAVMGARTLSNPRDRILTVLMMPFMSCGARFAIFTVFASAFFPHFGSLVIFGLYILGILAAIMTGFFFRRKCLPGKTAPLVLELPSYHRPQLRSMLRLTYRRATVFVKRAGRVIVPVCIVLGSLNSITVGGQVSHGDAGQNTVLSTMGRVVTPVLRPMGIRQDNWPATVGLITGVLAKEVVIGTLNTLYSQQAHLTVEQESSAVWGGLRAALWSVPANLSALAGAFTNPIAASGANVFMGRQVYGVMVKQFSSLAAAFSYLVFVLLYFPCISTLAIMRREIGKRWAAVSMGWSCVLAYGCAVFSYQLLTLPGHVLFSVLTAAAVLLVIYWVIRFIEYLSAHSLLEAG